MRLLLGPVRLTYRFVERRIALAQLDGLRHAALLHAGREGIVLGEIAQLHLIPEDALALPNRQLTCIVCCVRVLLRYAHLHQCVFGPVDLCIEIGSEVLLVREDIHLTRERERAVVRPTSNAV